MPLIIASGLLIALVYTTFVYTDFKKGLWDKDIRGRLLEILITKKTKLEKALYSRIYYTKSIAAYVSLHPDVTNTEYDNLAAELIRQDPVISSMALSKNCVIGAIYPVKGHEAAIGLDLLNHPKRREIVEKTIETHKTFVAGPVELVEGGMAFISYTPIFDKANHQSERFWGVTDIVIHKDLLLNEARLKEQEFGFIFALRGMNGSGDTGETFFGNDSVFRHDPVVVDVELPYGSWALAAIPSEGWGTYNDQDQILFVILVISSLIISILTFLFVRAMIKIRMNEQELKAIFRSMSSLIIEFDRDGTYVKIAPTNHSLLFRNEEEMLNKTVYEIFDEPTARFFHDSIIKCLDSKALVVIEYPLSINHEERWFTARISWKSDLTVIYQTYDITDQKKIQQELAISEQRLSELNATKDKFFSIIAHDLRSPFNQILGFSTILLDEGDQISPQDQQSYISKIYDGSKQTVWLIDNLLSWSQSQRGLLVYSPSLFQLSKLVHETLILFEENAERKEISLQVNISEEMQVYADKDMLSTILRNLVSNAIKYTPQKGTITVSSSPAQDSASKTIRVVVEDNGIGIDSSFLETIFLINQKNSLPGTQNEKGTGLGLILCKELVEKHGERIWVESEKGKGSRFIFTLSAESDPQNR
ncbi:MAG: CHASE domain-containing protein [Bacteroidales bacterium]|nr:CHASE domain-containing protein [Bacteroidales bacterium]